MHLSVIAISFLRRHFSCKFKFLSCCAQLSTSNAWITGYSIHFHSYGHSCSHSLSSNSFTPDFQLLCSMLALLLLFFHDIQLLILMQQLHQAKLHIFTLDQYLIMRHYIWKCSCCWQFYLCNIKKWHDHIQAFTWLTCLLCLSVHCFPKRLDAWWFDQWDCTHSKLFMGDNMYILPDVLYHWHSNSCVIKIFHPFFNLLELSACSCTDLRCQDSKENIHCHSINKLRLHITCILWAYLQIA